MKRDIECGNASRLAENLIVDWQVLQNLHNNHPSMSDGPFSGSPIASEPTSGDCVVLSTS